MALPNMNDLKSPEELQALEAELASLEAELRNIEMGKYSQDDMDKMDESALRAGAESYIEFDPDTALGWLQQGQALIEKREAREGKQDALLDDLRSTHNTYLNYLSALTAQGAQEDDPRVVEAKRIIDSTAKELRARGLPIGEDKKPENETDKKALAQNIANATAEAKPLIKTMVDENPKDGVADNRDDIYLLLNEIASKYNINLNSKEWQSILALVKTREETLQNQYKSQEEKSRQSFAQGQQQFGAFKDYVPVINASIDLKSNPNSFTSRQMGVGQVMKILSGLGVTDSERANTMVSLTNDEYQRQYSTRGKQYAEAFINKFLSNDQALLSEIAKNVDPEKVVKYLDQNTPDQAKTWFESTQKKPKQTGNPKPERKNYKSLSEYLKAVKAWEDGK